MIGLKIFTGDKKVLEKEIESSLKKIKSTNTKSIAAYQTVEVMISFYELLSTKETHFFETLLSCSYEEVLEKSRILQNYKMQNIIHTREEHERLCFHLNTFLDEIEIFDLKEENDRSKTLDEKEMYEIISDFFQIRNKNAASMLDYLIQEKRIFKIPDKEESARAYNLYNLFQNNFYIFVKKGENAITTMASIVHEIGHSMDEVQLLSIGKRKECKYYTEKSILIEVVSMMYEKEFLDFLLQEGVERESVELEIKGWFSSFQFFSRETELLFYLPDDLLKMNSYQNIAEEDLIHCLEEECSIIVNQEEIGNLNEMDLSDNLNWCYGFALSTYFSYLRGHDYSRYQESFRNFLKLRTNYFSPNTLERIGTTSLELSDITCEDYVRFSSKRLIK